MATSTTSLVLNLGYRRRGRRNIPLLLRCAHAARCNRYRKQIHQPYSTSWSSTDPPASPAPCMSFAAFIFSICHPIVPLPPSPHPLFLESHRRHYIMSAVTSSPMLTTCNLFVCKNAVVVEGVKKTIRPHEDPPLKGQDGK
ncbi:hypothetical protein BHM03_00062388 [Ensete ventricosum]|nr:hypothetical protein BHM03_00062388 [Ensete ventricosum]